LLDDQRRKIRDQFYEEAAEPPGGVLQFRFPVTSNA
jgi:hypothetical protein